MCLAIFTLEALSTWNVRFNRNTLTDETGLDITADGDDRPGEFMTNNEGKLYIELSRKILRILIPVIIVDICAAD